MFVGVPLSDGVPLLFPLLSPLSAGVTGFGVSGFGSGLGSGLGAGVGDITRQKSRRVFLSDFFSVYLFNYFSSLNT